MNLQLTNTLTANKEPFKPLKKGLVQMYHCGPTVKEPININKFRSYLLGDLLRRYFEFNGFEVKQVMNITDVGHLNEFEEDAVEIAAGRSGKQPWELVQEEEAEFHKHRHELGILDAHHYPRARENIPEMIDYIKNLLDSGVAYSAGENIYFDISRFPDFGKLLGKSFEELEKLHKDLRSPPHPEKRHPLDIDLWRTDVLHTMHWPSPWGLGFPGWHLECVVMSRKFLGDTFDIHTGSEEIIYPHHECEIAHAETLDGKPLTNYWLHSAHVLVDGKPISRSNQNLLTVKGLLESEFSGVEIRAALLSKHYREPMEFTPTIMESARENLTTLQEAIDRCDAARDIKANSTEESRLSTADDQFRNALDDDLNLPAALKIALELATDINTDSLSASSAVENQLRAFDRVLGYLQETPE